MSFSDTLYMFASSLVDLYGFINHIVGVAAVPSIAFG
jgi:hypothetical protein